MGYLLALMIGIEAVTGFAAWWQYRQVQTAVANAATCESGLATSRDNQKAAELSVATLAAERVADQRDMARLTVDRDAANRRAADADQRLNDLRGKINAEILKRPDVFQRASSRASARVMRDIESASADGNQDQTSRIGPVSSPAAAADSGDPDHK